ncbi:hypothetical protein DdX_10625 [Ditylenchus destructor]|uniref:Uncharacterized protein n=1 Tax=Ditylenchus destructor TaxID=166010 RepID=A0AAD4N0B5_9BILA|nr:hypothetical protein DdX_10625 [Ditylenchus destructor]
MRGWKRGPEIVREVSSKAPSERTSEKEKTNSVLIASVLVGIGAGGTPRKGAPFFGYIRKVFTKVFIGPRAKVRRDSDRQRFGSNSLRILTGTDQTC